jgi:hypothetical protein
MSFRLFRLFQAMGFFCLAMANVSIPHDTAVQQIYHYPAQHKIENLAVRSNGQILVTIASPHAQLWQIDPSNATAPILVKQFEGVGGCLGISENSHDIFYVATGNFTTYPTYTGVKGSFYLYEVDMNPFEIKSDGSIMRDAAVRQASHIEEATLLNGVASLNDPGCPAKDYVLVADTGASAVWSINIRTGKVTLAAQDVDMQAPANSTPIGINGIKVRDDYLYWTNTAKFALYRIPIDGNTGIAHTNSTAELLVENLWCDDFTFDSKGRVYVACSNNCVELADPQTGLVSVIVGNASSAESEVIGVKAVAFGRGALGTGQLYIATDGGAVNPIIADEGVSKMYVGDAGPVCI